MATNADRLHYIAADIEAAQAGLDLPPATFEHAGELMEQAYANLKAVELIVRQNEVPF
jgi:exonuclease VII small subunit